MKRLAVLWAVLALVACGGKAVVDGKAGAGGAGGGGSGAVACPNPPNDQSVSALVGKPCTPGAEVCASNDGCGGCSVSCKNGAWAATNAKLCFSIGAAC